MEMEDLEETAFQTLESSWLVIHDYICFTSGARTHEVTGRRSRQKSCPGQ